MTGGKTHDTERAGKGAGESVRVKKARPRETELALIRRTSGSTGFDGKTGIPFPNASLSLLI